jgi:hypothetical protein
MEWISWQKSIRMRGDVYCFDSPIIYNDPTDANLMSTRANDMGRDISIGIMKFIGQTR